MDKKIIAVMGATGHQGGALIRAILNDPESDFKARAITRNISEAKATALVNSPQVEVVEADEEDVDSLVNAFRSAYGVYCVTFYWNYMSPEKELTHAANLAKAVEKAGVKHVIWSSLEDTRNWIPLDDDRMPTLMEKYKVPHFDTKGESEKVYKSLSVPVTILRTSFYWENFISFGLGPQKGPDGNYAITFPMGDKKLPGISSEDIGKSAYQIFKAGTKYQGKTISIAGDHKTGQEMADTFTKILGVKVKYNEVTPEVYRNFGFPGADDMGNMFQFKRDFNKDYVGARDLTFSKSLNPELLDFETWLKQNKDKIPMG